MCVYDYVILKYIYVCVREREREGESIIFKHIYVCV